MKKNIKKKELYQILLERILFLDYQPGFILNEKLLIEEFGVSRSILREVLKRLEWEKLVITMPRTGTMITEVEFRNIMQVFQIRFDIEGLVGRLAAENITNEHLNKIENIRAEGSQLLDNGNLRDLVSLDIKFRDVLYDASDNPILKDLSQSLYNLTVRIYFLISDRNNWHKLVNIFLSEIDQTHEALSKKNQKEVDRLRRGFLRKHLERVKAKF
jgi:DNA-binding GntR family transcriptional regulator